MRAQIRHLHAEMRSTFVYVTHDQAEALTLADRIVVMRDGTIQQVGTPEDIADTAVWLCTDEARFITGQSLLVDGGFAIPGPR